MRPSLAAVLVSASLLSLGAVARAQTEPDPAPLSAVRASLQSLKARDAAPEKSRAALASLSASAAQLKLSDAPAIAALGRFKRAVASATAAPSEAKNLSELLKQVSARGDEFLAALPKSAAGTLRPSAAGDARAEEKLAATLDPNVGKRVDKVLKGGFEAARDPGQVFSVGPTIVSPGPRPAAGVSYLPVSAARVGASDLGIAVPDPGTKDPSSGFRVFAAAFDPGSYKPAVYAAWERFQPLLTPKPPGMPALGAVADYSTNFAGAFLSDDLLRSMTPAPRGANKNLPVTPVPVSTRIVAARTPALEIAGPVKIGGLASAKTLEPVSDGVLPSRGHAVHLVEGGGTIEVGTVKALASITASNFGNPTVKAGFTVGDTTLSGSVRTAGGHGNLPQMVTAGVAQDLGDGRSFRGDVSFSEKYSSYRFGYVVALVP